MSKRLIVITVVAFLLGVVGLTSLSIFASCHRGAWWFELALHTSSLIGSAGIVGFVFEFFIRRHAIVEFARQIHELFDADPKLAMLLSPQARQERVRNTLQAQLGTEIGAAVYDGLVSRYLAIEPPYRKDFAYKAALADLQQDVTLSPTLKLSKDKYYRLTMSQHFVRAFKYEPYLQVGCILADDFDELNSWFTAPDCIYRDTLVLNGNDYTAVRQLLTATPEKNLLPMISQILTLERISVHGVVLEPKAASLIRGGRSVGIRLKVPESLRLSGSRVTLARYEITISGLIAKAARKYPVIFGEPTQNPEISLRYPASDITAMFVATFFSGKCAFQPQIVQQTELREITVTVPRVGEESAWVFPSSGAIFLWDYSHDNS